MLKLLLIIRHPIQTVHDWMNDHLVEWRDKCCDAWDSPLDDDA